MAILDKEQFESLCKYLHLPESLAESHEQLRAQRDSLTLIIDEQKSLMNNLRMIISNLMNKYEGPDWVDRFVMDGFHMREKLVTRRDNQLEPL